MSYSDIHINIFFFLEHNIKENHKCSKHHTEILLLVLFEWGKAEFLGTAAAYGPTTVVALDDRWMYMKHW
jgi:hypothetical protein